MSYILIISLHSPRRNNNIAQGNNQSGALKPIADRSKVDNKHSPNNGYVKQIAKRINLFLKLHRIIGNNSTGVGGHPPRERTCLYLLELSDVNALQRQTKVCTLDSTYSHCHGEGITCSLLAALCTLGAN